ncbi:zinc finger cchc domain containing protein [Anaeramoeba flamelloides]|uniref:Zinc finger cchc domain containing protein n=1 Tax=Anaeramoeba flamelloides TaxID=1746091 RepID=A0ABQ8YNH3_9EUKA|nr:zinc finger cchc domain containing protein [Anaeramoeba flamelloides]
MSNSLPLYRSNRIRYTHNRHHQNESSPKQYFQKQYPKKCCHFCGNPNHFINNCPIRYKIIQQKQQHFLLQQRSQQQKHVGRCFPQQKINNPNQSYNQSKIQILRRNNQNAQMKTFQKSEKKNNPIPRKQYRVFCANCGLMGHRIQNCNKPNFEQLYSMFHNYTQTQINSKSNNQENRIENDDKPLEIL